MVSLLKHCGVKWCQTEGVETLLGSFTRGFRLNHSDLRCRSPFQSLKKKWRAVAMFLH